MELTKSKLIRLIREELRLIGGINPEENFIRKYGIILPDDDDNEIPVYDAFRSGIEVREAEPEDLEKVTEAKKKRKLTKIQIKRRDKLARKIMPDTKKEYGKKRGKDIAYAIATKQVKKNKRTKT